MADYEPRLVVREVPGPTDTQRAPELDAPSLRFGPRMSVVAGAPAADGMFQPASIIAPVRVVGVNNPTEQRAIAESLAPEINRLVQVVQSDHQLSGRKFSHAQHIVGDARLRMVVNGNQSYVEVSPVPSPDEQIDLPELPRKVEEEIADPPVTVEGWVVRYEYVEWVGAGFGPGVTTLGFLNMPPESEQWFVNFAYFAAEQMSKDSYTTIPDGFRKTFPAFISFGNRNYWSIFYWALREQGFNSEAEARAFVPQLSQVDAERGLWRKVRNDPFRALIGNFWYNPTWVPDTTNFPFVPVPNPVVVDVYRVSRTVRGFGPLIAQGNPALRPAVSILNEAIMFVENFLPPDPPD